MLNVSAYPQCAKRLHFQRANLSDPLMKPIWAAVCVAEDFTDEDLAEFGGFNFDDYSDENGFRQLSRLEEFIVDRRRKAKELENSPEFIRKAKMAESARIGASEGLKAFLGSRGVKTSALASEDDYWTASETLFPGHIKRQGGLSSLYVQIQAIPKKMRGELGRTNMRNLPPHWLGKVVDRRPDLFVKPSPTPISETAA